MSKIIEKVRQREAETAARQARARRDAWWQAEGERQERAIERQIFAIEEKKRNKKWWQFWL